MSEDPKSRRERLLALLLSGEISPDEDRVKKLREESSEFREELDRLSAIHTRLANEATEQQQILADLEKEPQPTLEADLEQAFRTIAASPPGKAGTAAAPQRPARKPRRWPLLTAAAVLIVLIWIPWGDLANDSPSPSDQRLGDPKEIVCLSPQGPVLDYGTFRWSPPTDLEMDSYHLHILEKTASGEVVRFKELSRLRATEYTPAFELPDRIIWRVLGYNRSRVLVAQGEEEAYRIGR